MQSGLKKEASPCRLTGRGLCVLCVGGMKCQELLPFIDAKQTQSDNYRHFNVFFQLLRFLFVLKPARKVLRTIIEPVVGTLCWQNLLLFNRNGQGRNLIVQGLYRKVLGLFLFALTLTFISATGFRWLYFRHGWFC